MYFEIADIINIAGLFLNLGCLFLVAIFFQNIQVNSRTLKDYYIQEYDTASKDLLSFISVVEKGNILPEDVKFDFIGHVATLNNISVILANNYKIDFNVNNSKIIFLQRLVEDDPNFQANFSTNRLTSLDIATLSELNDFRTNTYKTVQYLTINDINNYKINIFKAIFTK